MLTYFWVALGGAIGSMARLWLSVHVALLTGLAFPWGTILVNIIGSLVIGFVATLDRPERTRGCPDQGSGLCDGRSVRRVHDLLSLQPADTWSSRETDGCCTPGPT